MLLIEKRRPIGHRFCYLPVIVIARRNDEAIQIIRLYPWIASFLAMTQSASNYFVTKL